MYKLFIEFKFQEVHGCVAYVYFAFATVNFSFTFNFHCSYSWSICKHYSNHTKRRSSNESVLVITFPLLFCISFVCTFWVLKAFGLRWWYLFLILLFASLAVFFFFLIPTGLRHPHWCPTKSGSALESPTSGKTLPSKGDSVLKGFKLENSWLKLKEYFRQIHLKFDLRWQAKLLIISLKTC